MGRGVVPTFFGAWSGGAVYHSFFWKGSGQGVAVTKVQVTTTTQALPRGRGSGKRMAGGRSEASARDCRAGQGTVPLGACNWAVRRALRLGGVLLVTDEVGDMGIEQHYSGILSLRS